MDSAVCFACALR